MASSMNKEIRIVNHSASGSSAKIHHFGATVISFTCSHGKEHLFVSEKALLDGSMPIRGGIPLVFPIFGAPTSSSTMPQHGFARRNVWTFVSDYDNEESAGCTFQLDFKDVQEGKGENNEWADGLYDCTLLLTVDISAARLTTILNIQNTGTIAFPFQALQHTYFQISDHAVLQADQCYVTGLQGYTIQDKVDASQSGKIQDADKPVRFPSEVDRVFTPPSNIDVVCLSLGTGAGQQIHMNAFGSVGGKVMPISCVVWNPYQQKAESMADFGNDEYHDMICVEPGILRDDVILEPGAEAKLEQVMHV